MRHHRLAILVMALTAVLGTGAAVAGPAHATTPGPRPHISPNPPWAGNYFGPVKFEVYDANVGDINCIVTNGEGSQLSIKSLNGNYCARIYGNYAGTVLIGNTQYNTYWLNDGHNNCLRANSSSVVNIQNGPCNTTGSDLNEIWVLTSCVQYPPGICGGGMGGKWRWENLGRQAWMKVNSDTSGQSVWVGFGGYNEWDLWPG